MKMLAISVMTHPFFSVFQGDTQTLFGFESVVCHDTFCAPLFSKIPVKSEEHENIGILS